MADLENKVLENVYGKFYVDNTCIDCDLCRTIAPEHFKRQEEEGYTYVYNQPKNEEEQQHCLEAIDACPTESIGNNGIVG